MSASGRRAQRRFTRQWRRAVRSTRRWPAQRVALAALAAALLLSAAWLGHVAPLLAQEGEAAAPEATGASGVTIRMDDLVDRITYTIVDRFQVQLSGLDAATTYEIRVSSDGPRLGLGGCGTAARSQTATVTGETAQDLLFIVWACGLGAGTVTAEVRAAGAATAAVTVSQGVTVLPIPDYVPAAERRAAERSLRGVSGATTPVKTPGIVMNLQHGRFATEIEYTWSKPGSGSFPLSGYGVLMWKGSEDHPGWGEAVNHPTSPRRKRYTGLELNTLYKFRIHACSYDRDNDVSYCGWWTDIHEVRTGRKPDPPHTISFDQRSLTSVRAQWSIAADSGGVSRTGFLIRYWPRSNTRDTTTVHVTDKDARRHTLTGLRAGTRYAAKLRTCNDTQSCTVGDWSADHHFETTSPEQVKPIPTVVPTPVAIDPVCPTISGTAVLPANMQVDLVPQPRRLASLCWSPSLYAISYFVQATDTLSNLHDPDRSGWQAIHGTADQTHVADKAQRLQLDLDQLITTSGSVVGLADHAAYGIRIGMRTVTNGVSNITYTKAIIIIDTPIVEANGASGTVKIQWDTAGTVLQPTGFGTGSYELRHRQSTGDLRSLSWTPKEFALPAVTPFTATTNPDTLSLASDHIHAVQFIYRDDPDRADSPDADVFAARNVYVWPSTTTPSDGYRLATYHLSPRLSDQTLIYRICLETFGPTTDPRTGKWETLIRHAFERWSTATHGLVKVGRALLPCAEAEGEYPPGTGTTQTYNYKRMTDDIVTLSGSSLTSSQIKTQIINYINGLRSNGVVGELRKQSGAQREIIMYDDIALESVRLSGAFFEIADDLGYWQSCWFFPSGKYEPAKMCTVPVSDGSVVTHDIIVRRSTYKSDGLEVPGADARFNMCPSENDRAYADMLHEIGHVLGLGGGSTSLPTYYQSHPGHSIVSVMNYEEEDDCAPHPLDVMSIFAIYQNRFTTP